MQVHLYFAYGSSYSYLAWARITKALAKRWDGVEVLWKPVRFARLMELQGHDGTGPSNEGPYARRDTARWALAYDVPMRYPPSYPIDSSDAARAHLLAEMEGPAKEAAWLAACMAAHWEQGRDISDPAVLEDLAREAGLPPLGPRLRSEGIEKLLEANTQEAVAAGAPGVPFAVLEGEGFWGNDRLDWVEAMVEAMRGG
ncbi:MAG: hypothetical protein QOD77_634 [Thermoplasmata archaeon]|jgi:2-hydroxychromene-2-carboxylate isomerase|nr:hypothetical protein [Thermoplasmata archaeon]